MRQRRERTGRAIRMLRAAVAAWVLLAGSAASAAAQHPPEAMAVVVHAAVPVENVSLTHLRTIFLGEQQFWPGGERITLLLLPPGSHPRKVVLESVYRMNETAFRRYWIAKIFRAEVSSGPKVVDGVPTALRLVDRLPGAISIIPAAAVRSGDRVLRVNGRLPGEPGYPL